MIVLYCTSIDSPVCWQTMDRDITLGSNTQFGMFFVWNKRNVHSKLVQQTTFMKQYSQKYLIKIVTQLFYCIFMLTKLLIIHKCV